MSTGATAQYYVRVAGSDSNGGGYDAGISGAGTNYADQDSAQLALTGLSCVANATTLTQTGASFTSAMVGNAIQITGGTNFLKDIYWIASFTDSNNVVLDRTPATAGAGSAGTGNLGGALATLKCLSSGGSGLPSNPLNTTTQLVPGNTINIRGQGSGDPGTVDYDFSAGYWVFPSGNTTTGPIRLIGYNGRPLLGLSGLLAFSTDHWIAKHLKVQITTNTYFNLGFINGGDHGSIDCIFDQNGSDCMMINATSVSGGGCINCEIRNSGSAAAGAQPALLLGNYFSIAQNSWIHGVKGPGIKSLAGAAIIGNIINGCGDDAILMVSGGYGLSCVYNTIDGNAGNGINLSTNSLSIQGVASIAYNIISNHTTASKYGINCSSGSAGANTLLPEGVIDVNAFYNNTHGNYNGINTNTSPTLVGANDISLSGDPFNNRAGNDFSLNNTAGAGAAARSIAHKVGTLT